MSYYCPNFGSLREHLYICEAVGPPAHKEVGGDNGNDQIGDHLTYTSPPSTEPSVYQAPPTKRARTTRDAQSPRTEMKLQHSPLPTTLSEEKTLQLSHQHRSKQNKGKILLNPKSSTNHFQGQTIGTRGSHGSRILSNPGSQMIHTLKLLLRQLANVRVEQESIAPLNTPQHRTRPSNRHKVEMEDSLYGI